MIGLHGLNTSSCVYKLLIPGKSLNLSELLFSRPENVLIAALLPVIASEEESVNCHTWKGLAVVANIDIRQTLVLAMVLSTQNSPIPKQTLHIQRSF